MGNYYIRQGSTYQQTSSNAIDIQENLPAGTYALRYNEQAGAFYFEMIKDFELPSKLYGDCNKLADRIIATFEDRPNSTGVLLEGEKGSGKTLLAKNVCTKLKAKGVPTVVVNTPFAGEVFNVFVQTMTQPAVFLFDEFEKVYDPETQQKVLTLFDGVYPTKKLYLVTSNDKYKIDAHMRNRPGRIYYMLTYGGLDRDFITEYANEKLNDVSQVNSIITVAQMFAKFNFDMLKALIEEMNRFDESAGEAIKMLNSKPESNVEVFQVRLAIGGEPAEEGSYHDSWRGSPLSGTPITIGWENDLEGEDYEHKLYKFLPSHLKKIDGTEGKYIFVNADGDSLVLTRPKEEKTDWQSLVM
jgi:hypothetical protein